MELCHDSTNSIMIYSLITKTYSKQNSSTKSGCGVVGHSVTAAHEGLRQEDYFKFKASLGLDR